MVYHLHQHSIGYLGDGFTGQKPNQQYQSTEEKMLQRKTREKNKKYTYTYKTVHYKEKHT